MADGEDPFRLDIRPFPEHCLIPKRETGAERFLARLPEYDGRGVVIAILDTGVDPAAPGLQLTSDGSPKIVDLYDTSGSGDVDTSTIRTTTGKTSGRIIDGLTGRKLKIPDSWSNPSQKWHVGVKAAFELFPTQLKSRIQKDFVDKKWIPVHMPLLTAAEKELKEFETQNKSDNSIRTRLQKEDLQAKVDLLTALSGKNTIAGPVYDCVVFYDGTSWSAVLDTSERGDLPVSCLKTFKESKDWAKFGDQDQFTYSVNIYDDGNFLSIVTTGGSHGTHVASITAAYFPESPERNGVAPGAQLVSIKVGDTRLNTMETASSIIRACSLLADMDCELVNFSYGEASYWTNKGPVLEQLTSLVRKHNVTFVSSAGNNGPALSTVGCPGGNTDALIGVAAFISPDMMAGAYSLIKTKPCLPYTWSSKGPSADGDLGLSITAPGAAFTSVPNWTLQQSMLMNGTSMSSPNACGNIGLLLSALKAQSIPYTPASIKKALERTAKPLESHDAFSIGHGVLQVDRAYDHMMEIYSFPTASMDFKISVAGQQGQQSKCRGIYLRDSHHLKRTAQHSVTVEPCFHENTSADAKLNFLYEIALVPTQSWVHAPKHFILASSSRQFGVTVDHTGLEPGAHYAEVRGYSAKEDKGPLFIVPITVIIPYPLNKKTAFECKVELSNHVIKRYFFHVPQEATWAEVVMTNCNEENHSKVWVQTIQLLSEKAYRDKETLDVITLEPEATNTVIVPTVGGYTLEVCVTQYWSEINPLLLSLNVIFHSLRPSNTTFTFHSSTSWTRLDVSGNYRVEDLYPEFKLTHYCQPKRPVDAVIKPQGARDRLLDGRQIYELKLTYTFHLNKNCEVRPNAHLLSDLLYESPYCGQLWMIYNHHKQLVGSGDAYPKSYCIKLDKGDYTMLLQVRHDVKGELESLKEMPITLEIKLPYYITMDVYTSRSIQTKWSSTVAVKPGCTLPVYITALSDERVNKAISSNNPGDCLTGTFTLTKTDQVKKRVHYPLQYVIGPKAIKSSSGSGGAVNKKKDKKAEYEKAFKDFKLQWMSKGYLSSVDLEGDFGHDLDFLMARLRIIEGDKKSVWSDVVESLVDKIVSQLQIQDILAHQGTKTDLSQDSSERASTLDKQKTTLVEVRLLEGSILLRQNPANIPHLEAIYTELSKLLDQKDAKLKGFKLKFVEALGLHGLTAKLVDEEINDKGSNKLSDERLIKLYRQLGWDHAAELLEGWLPRKYPDSYQLF